MNSNNKSIFYLLLAVLSVTFFYQVSFIPFVEEAQNIRDNSLNRIGNIFATAAASNRMTFIFMLCNFCSIGLSILTAFLSNLISDRKIFSKWYWLFLAAILLFMVISYKFYFFDRISFLPGSLFSLRVWIQTTINIIFHGALFIYVYQKIWMLPRKVATENNSAIQQVQ